MRRRTPPAISLDTRSSAARVAEAAAVSAVSGAVAALTGVALGMPVVTGVIGAANGAISGWRGTYDWRRWQGVAAIGLDNSWALATTFTGLVSHVVARLQTDGGGYAAHLSHRQDRHVYARGMVLRTGFATTWGNVVSGAAAVHGESPQADRRRRLVTDHEDVHVWQARLFGPVYPTVYVSWMVLGGAVGVVRWVLHRDAPFTQYVESSAYYANPFEWWAYSRDDHWPPRQALAARIWRRPMARPLRSLR